ncbi:MAG: sugar ABC transporter permease [Desulfobacterales bacterium]|jgi:multiple sugar transport system permease protein|nr:MAG: sugar ABC transporter permease [Desulfobacterales bacterium]
MPKIQGSTTSDALKVNTIYGNLGYIAKNLADNKPGFMLQLVMPALIFMFLFQILPIFHGIYTSLTDYPLWQGYGTFVGLKNYISMLSKPHFYTVVLLNTVLFTIVAVTVEMCGGIAIGHLFNQSFRGEYLVRSLLLLPLMISRVISGVMVRWIFNDQYGILNVILRWIGIDPPSWFAERSTAMFLALLAEVWTWTPWYAIFVLAALQVQPVSPKEAARVDGANAWQVFRHVTLPFLRPVLAVCTLIRTFDAFAQFDHVWTITRGGPGRSTELLSVFAYKESFIYLKMGQGAAAGMISALVMLIFGLLLFRRFYRFTYRL